MFLLVLLKKKKKKKRSVFAGSFHFLSGFTSNLMVKNWGLPAITVFALNFIFCSIKLSLGKVSLLEYNNASNLFIYLISVNTSKFHILLM